MFRIVGSEYSRNRSGMFHGRNTSQDTLSERFRSDRQANCTRHSRTGGSKHVEQKIDHFRLRRAMLTAMSAAPARAQGGPMDSRTEFTFNQPVELPDVTLPPGTYIFRFVDATTGTQSDAGAGERCEQQDVRHVHDDLGPAPEGVRQCRASLSRDPCRSARRGENVVVSGQYHRPRVHLSEVAGAPSRPGDEPTGARDEGRECRRAEERTDLVYVSPSGQETPLTDEQLVDASREHATGWRDGATARRGTARDHGARRVCRRRARRSPGLASLGCFHSWVLQRSDSGRNIETQRKKGV